MTCGITDENFSQLLIIVRILFIDTEIRAFEVTVFRVLFVIVGCLVTENNFSIIFYYVENLSFKRINLHWSSITIWITSLWQWTRYFADEQDQSYSTVFLNKCRNRRILWKYENDIVVCWCKNLQLIIMAVTNTSLMYPQTGIEWMFDLIYRIFIDRRRDDFVNKIETNSFRFFYPF